MSLLVPLVLAAPLAGGDPDPRALVEAADAACRAARTAAYRVEFEGRGAGPSEQRWSAAVWIEKWAPEPAPPPPPPAAEGGGPVAMPAMRMRPAHLVGSRLRANVRMEMTDGRVYLADEEWAMLVRPKQEHAMKQQLAHGGERLLDAPAIAVGVRTPLLDTISLAEEIAEHEVVWLGTETVVGVPCDHLVITTPARGDRERTLHLYLGKADHLLRRREERIGAIVTMTSYRDLAVNAPLPSGTFAPRVPDGLRERVIKAPPQRRPLEAGATAPEFRLPRPDGTMVALADLRGQVLVLDFWGTWCGPCRRAMPAVQRLHESFGDRGVQVIGLASRERDRSAPAKMMEELGFTYGLLLDGESIAGDYQVPGYPTLYVIDAEGRIVHGHVGFTETLYDDVAAAIERALGE